MTTNWPLTAAGFKGPGVNVQQDHEEVASPAVILNFEGAGVSVTESAENEVTVTVTAGATGAQGPTGATGSAGGATGATGADGATGPGNMNYTGAWSGLTTYVANDVVLSGGNVYLCLTGHTDEIPPSAKWQKIGSY